jgi:NCAIR mutase (PurE)-related protein
VPSPRRSVPAYADLGFAKVDLDRTQRQGFPEVIFAQGKTASQLVDIARQIFRREKFVLISRVDSLQAKAVQKIFRQAVWHEAARTVVIGAFSKHRYSGVLSILCAGTSDLPVAEQAAVTAEAFGLKVQRIYDVGVAGLHRLLDQLPAIRKSHLSIVVAGMEGALPSVVAGLVDHPVIAVPTSVGYGANLGGVAALLGMLNSCGSGVVVVNIDNGFGAAFAAAQMLKVKPSS